MKVGDKEKESSILTSTTSVMGATSETPTPLVSSSVSVTAPITSLPSCSSVLLATTVLSDKSPKAVVCLPSGVTSLAEPTSLQKEAALGKREEPSISQIKTKDSAGPDKKEQIIVSESNIKTLAPEKVASDIVHAGSQSLGTFVISSTTQAQGLIPSSPQFPSATTSSFQSSLSISSDGARSKIPPPFLSRPPPVPPLSRFLPPFSSFPLSKNGGSNRFAWPSNGNVPPSSHSYLMSSMRPPVSGHGQPHYTTTGPSDISSLARAPPILSLPSSSSGSMVSHLHESQVRSYSFPRGPPPPSVPYGMGRNHSWPCETSGPSLALLRPSFVTSSPTPPPFLSSAFTQGPLQRAGVRPPQTLRISKWVNPIPPDPDDGQQQTGEQELATKMLQIQSKRFYIDVKQNRRGRFMKVAEIGADGRRNQVFLALSTAAEFRDHLSMFSEFYSNLGPPNPDTLPEDGKLKSETMVKDNRRYYLDLKENSRGRFLRVSQTIARGGPRCQIAIPAQGMIEFRDALQELLEEFGTDDGGFKGELPEGRHMRVENKNFYFDIGQNNRGIYMRISEVKTNFRTAITIPEKSWSRFRDIFADYVDKMKEGGDKNSSESNK